ncbi:hypothetical protein PRK78_002813 [Emydomyces testavorans]|uniref:Uncharacterized protein n=1 Tax=Emydomyces testavorans TaxID=2070801 RepID=A0AAF0DF24_9EURO|nr:hypothetical protein PRK78_002813 [Emydomyces testavorans]
MAPRRADLTISAPLSNPTLRTDSSHEPNLYHPLTPIMVSSVTSQRQTHASYPPMHSSLPFDGTQHTSYHSRFASYNPQPSVSGSLGQRSTMNRRRASVFKRIMRKLFNRKHQSDPVIQDSGFNDKTHTTTPSQGSIGLRNSGTQFLTVAEAARCSIKSSSTLGHTTPIEPTVVEITPFPKETEGDTQLKSPRKRPRRRATLPSLVLSTDEARELANKIAQQGLESESVCSPLMDQTSIETPLRMTDTQLKRRSRSAYALRESARAHRMSPIQWRRRSAEIKRWRVDSDKEAEAEPAQDRSETPSTTGEEEDPTEIRVKNLAPDVELGQFDFGNLISNIQEDNDVSLTQRVSTLEVKLMDLEFAIAKMQGSDISPIQPLPLIHPSKKATAGSQNSDSESSAPPLSSSLRVSPSHHATPPRSSPTDTSRPLSTATLRPNTSTQHSSSTSPSSFTSPGISVEQYSALTTLLRREQSARKNLESQVLQLQREVQQLRGGPASVQGNFLRSSSPDSSSTTSLQRDARQVPLDSGMRRQASESSGGRNDNVSLDSYPARSESSFHRMNALDRIMGRS